MITRASEISVPIRPFESSRRRFQTRFILVKFIAALLLVGSVGGSRVRADVPSIATVGLTPGWVTFGEAVPQGMAFDGLRVEGLTTQTDVKTRWSDGSIRFAVVSVNVPSAQDYAVTAGPSSGAPFVPVLPHDTSVTLQIGADTYVAALPADASSDRWLSGDLVYEGRSVVVPIRMSDGQPHAFLRVIFDTRVYANTTGRVDVTVENVLDKIGATTVTYNAMITVNGSPTPCFSKPSVEHFYLTRWRKMCAVGSDAGSIKPDMTPFNLSRALPPYLPMAGTPVDPESHFYDMSGSLYEILHSGTLDSNMPAHGGNPDLAPFPDWVARYLVSKDPGQRAFVLANGDLSGSWPVHVREPEDLANCGTAGNEPCGVGAERFVSLNQRPIVWYDERATTDFMRVFGPDGMTIVDDRPLDYIKGTPLPLREYGSTDPGPGQSPLIPDNAHQPSLAYVPYLLTGDRYFAEEMAFWANYAMLRTYPADGVRGSDGILDNNEVRGYGWALRNIADAAAYYPGAEVRTYLSQKVQGNFDWLDSLADAAKSDPNNPFQILWIGKRPEPGYISLWEQTYLAYAIDRANRQGFTGGLKHRDAIINFQLQLFTNPDYPRFDALGTWSAPYLVKVGTVPDPDSWDGFTYYQTMIEVTANTVGNPDLQRDFAGYYGPEARLNLLALLDGSNSAAQEPYTYLWPFIGSTNSYCAQGYGGTGGADRPDLACRAGWALGYEDGRYYPAASVITITVCSPGSYLASPGDTTCTPAPAGSYVGTTGATSATPCPVGTYSPTTGAIACTPAPAGSYVSTSGATSATPCPVGTYSPTTGAIACTPAPPGRYVGSTGATSATPCPAGTYSAVTGAVACTPAPAGSYVSTTGATSATPCPAGTTSSVGATTCVPTNPAAAQLQSLLATVNGLGPGNSFAAKVKSAQSALAAGNAASAAAALQALINEVNAQSGKKITAGQAAAIISAARQIRAVLGY